MLVKLQQQARKLQMQDRNFSRSNSCCLTMRVSYLDSESPSSFLCRRSMFAPIADPNINVTTKPKLRGWFARPSNKHLTAWPWLSGLPAPSRLVTLCYTWPSAVPASRVPRPLRAFRAAASASSRCRWAFSTSSSFLPICRFVGPVGRKQRGFGGCGRITQMRFEVD